MLNSKCKHCGDPKKGHYAGPAKCKNCGDPPEGHDYNCTNCGQPKEGCGAWLKEKNPDVLYNMCKPWSKPDMDLFNALIKAGAPIRTTVRRN